MHKEKLRGNTHCRCFVGLWGIYKELDYHSTNIGKFSIILDNINQNKRRKN